MNLHRSAPRHLADRWGGSSQISDLGRRGPVHWVDFGGPAGAPPVVCVHGLGGSHLNWVLIASQLAKGRRVMALDLAGFGLTQGTALTTTVKANTELLGRFVREVGRESAILVGNSMGGMISLMLASSEPELVAGLILVDPAVPRGSTAIDPAVAAQSGMYSVPLAGELFYHWFKTNNTAEKRVHGTIQMTFAEPSRADEAVNSASVQLMNYLDTQRTVGPSYVAAARSMLRVLRNEDAYSRLIRSVEKPTLLVHGERDRLVQITSAKETAARNPAWDTTWLEGVGHTPQLEAPARMLAAVLPWLDRVS